MEAEGQQFGRTEWYLILHDIETNQFFVCVLLQIKNGIKPGTATNEQKGRIWKNRTVLDIETILFSKTRILLSITIITKLERQTGA